MRSSRALTERTDDGGGAICCGSFCTGFDNSIIDVLRVGGGRFEVTELYVWCTSTSQLSVAEMPTEHPNVTGKYGLVAQRGGDEISGKAYRRQEPVEAPLRVEVRGAACKMQEADVVSVGRLVVFRCSCWACSS